VNADDVVFVTLEPHQVEYAALVGIARQRAATEQKRREYVPSGALWGAHVTGALGELAVSLALDVAWLPNIGGTDREHGDVLGYQVRATPRDTGPLVIRDRDADTAAFVLVTGEPPRLAIRGWIYAAEGRAVGERRAPNGRPPADLVEQCHLYAWVERPYSTRAAS
jgi:hypothetical protein